MAKFLSLLLFEKNKTELELEISYKDNDRCLTHKTPGKDVTREKVILKIAR